MLGPIFCSAVRPILLRLDLWHRDIEAGWMEVFRLLTNQMHHGYELAASNHVVTSGAGRVRRLSEPELTASQRCCIQATWQAVFQKRTKDLGAQTFIDLFQGRRALEQGSLVSDLWLVITLSINTVTVKLKPKCFFSTGTA
jgi:hypothetical protein